MVGGCIFLAVGYIIYAISSSLFTRTYTTIQTRASLTHTCPKGQGSMLVPIISVPFFSARPNGELGHNFEAKHKFWS